MFRKSLVAFLALFLVSATLSTGYGSSTGQYPTKAVKLVLTHGAGSGIDMAARLIQPYLQKELGKPIVISAMEGASGRVARTKVFKEKNDGYTLLVTNFPSTQLGELLYKGDYKTAEFTPIYGFMGAENPFVLYVANDSPYKTYQEMVSASQKKPMVIGIAGLGSGSHLVASWLKFKGLNANIIPYPAAQVILNVMGHQIDAGADSADGVVAEDGQRIRIILQTNDGKRSSLIPNVPTTAESGLPGIDYTLSAYIFGPPNTPKEVVNVIAKAMDKVTKDPKYLADCKRAGQIPSSIGPDAVKKINENMMNRLSEIVPIIQRDMNAAGQAK